MILKIERLSKSYRQAENVVRVLDNLNLQLDEGDMIALMGSSGEGKTTLMQILGCLDRPDSGRYWLHGRELSCLAEEELAGIRNRDIGFIFQSSYFVDYLNLVENVALPGMYQRDATQHEAHQRASRLLEQVGLGHRLAHKPSELSGGERQRAAIARALLNRPQLLLADEPTGNLDAQNTRQIMAQLAALNAQGLTIVLVTHEEAVAAYADRIFELGGGNLTERTSVAL